MWSEHRRMASIAVNVVAATYAVVATTGLLVITLAVVGWFNGYTIADLYAETFPRFRGGGGPMRISMTLRAIFVAYVLVAAQMALYFRKRLAKRLLES